MDKRLERYLRGSAFRGFALGAPEEEIRFDFEELAEPAEVEALVTEARERFASARTDPKVAREILRIRRRWVTPGLHRPFKTFAWIMIVATGVISVEGGLQAGLPGFLYIIDVLPCALILWFLERREQRLLARFERYQRDRRAVVREAIARRLAAAEP